MTSPIATFLAAFDISGVATAVVAFLAIGMGINLAFKSYQTAKTASKKV